MKLAKACQLANELNVSFWKIVNKQVSVILKKRLSDGTVKKIAVNKSKFLGADEKICPVLSHESLVIWQNNLSFKLEMFN